MTAAPTMTVRFLPPAKRLSARDGDRQRPPHPESRRTPNMTVNAPDPVLAAWRACASESDRALIRMTAELYGELCATLARHGVSARSHLVVEQTAWKVVIVDRNALVDALNIANDMGARQ
jgi:hypothetical protein